MRNRWYVINPELRKASALYSSRFEPLAWIVAWAVSWVAWALDRPLDFVEIYNPADYYRRQQKG